MRARHQAPSLAQPWILLAAAVAFAVVWLFPAWVYLPAWDIGYAVCHQLPEHSYFAGPWQLPLCARCTGQYLGAFAALVYLLWQGKERAARWPDFPVLVIIGVGLAAWMGDGVNSFAASLGAPHVYPPQQPLRLATGLVAGIGWMTLFWPLWVRAMVAAPEDQPLWRLQDVPALAGIAALVGIAVHFGPAFLRFAMGILSALTAWLLLALTIGAGLRLLGGARLPAWLASGAGLVGACTLIVTVSLLRTALTSAVGM